jgi:hypothetical protein
MHLLDRHHAVPGGRRIRLRLPRISDRAALGEFLDTLGLSTDDLDVRRRLRWAPASGRWSVVATRWDGAREQIVGLAVVDDADGSPTLLADDAAVCDLLARALAERAETARPGRRVA